MSEANHLDPHQRAPTWMRPSFKKYQKCAVDSLENDPDLIDLSRIEDGHSHQLRRAFSPSFGNGTRAFRDFLSNSAEENNDECLTSAPIFEVVNIPGLYIVPGLIPPKIQILLLTRLLHRDLSNPLHLTNVHLHHDIVYPTTLYPGCISSFFHQNSSTQFPPLDSNVHRQISVAEFLKKRLRWMTLGAQYDWTTKCYAPERAPPFPADLKKLLNELFPSTDAQAAILNLYSSGDTLSLHRDVSEHCDQGLVSISLGCDGLFLVGHQHTPDISTIRLRSGDVLYMTGSSRYAWHGMPKVIPGTCPNWLSEWPATSKDTRCNEWRGWMSSKRINLNVRQVDVKL